MARYLIRITFDNNPSGGDELIIDSPISTERFYFEFYTASASRNGVAIGATIADTTYNFRIAFMTYYNSSGAYTLLSGSDWLEIEGEFANAPVLGQALPASISWTVTLLLSIMHLSSLAIQKNVADTCNKFDILITADKVFDEIITPVPSTFSDTTTKVVASLNRDQIYAFKIKNSDGQEATKTIETPSFLNVGLIEVVVFNNTITINDTTRDLTLEYSLDDSNWQFENVFAGLNAGAYTIYVRDQYDCKVNTGFTIAEGADDVTSTLVPYFKYPKSNSLRMAIKEQWDELLIHKNSSNTLSCEVLDDVSYSDPQLWKSGDDIILQFKTNYTDLEVETTDDDTLQTLVQKTANMNVKYSLDGKVTSLGLGKFGIYFISGKTYNYDTDADLSNDHYLNGSLPQFGKKSNIITIDGFNYTIEEVSFNQTLEVWQIVVSSTVLVDDDSDIVKSIYNVLNYEVYECTIDLTGRDLFNVLVSYDGATKLRSENILIDDVSLKLAYIEWSHSKNTDMFWGTGIVQNARILYDTINAVIKNESDGYETDTDSLLIDTSNFEVDLITFLPLTKEVAKCLILWLSNDNVWIRGIKYRKQELSLEPHGKSNLYTVKATMIIRDSGLTTEQTDLLNTEIPVLLELNSDGYLKLN